MAKELPYFKYYPSEWFIGDITLCSIEAQGLFINIINFYWLKDCSICLANVKQRFSKHEALLKELFEHNIIKVDDEENIIIDFLDEQMQEFIDVRAKRAIAGAKGGKANAKQMLSKRKAKVSNKEDIRKDNIKDILSDFKKQNPDAVDICNHFMKTLDPDSRYIPKTDARKLAWLKCSRWAINKMGKNGKEKVEDIITFYRSGDADNNGFSWVENWQSLLKIQKKNKEEVFYLDYFYEKAKNNFVYGKSGINQENVIKRLKSELQHLDSGVYKNVSEVVAIFQGKAKEIVLEKLKDMNYIKKSLKS